MRNYADIVVADEDEAHALVGTQSFEELVPKLQAYGNLFAVTRSEKGSVIVHGDEVVTQEATPVERVIDSTGAGDAYSAGFLFGWANDKSLQECAQYGTYCATKVIQQMGARIEKGLLDGR